VARLRRRHRPRARRESRLEPETPRFPIMSAGGKNVDGCGQIRVVARRFGWHQRGLGHDVGARGPTSTPQRLLRATKPADLQLLPDGETRTRTGDTTIFRESWEAGLSSERPAKRRVRGRDAVPRSCRLRPVARRFGTSRRARSPKRPALNDLLGAIQRLDASRPYGKTREKATAALVRVARDPSATWTSGIEYDAPHQG
jgi:hypothetical protein